MVIVAFTALHSGESQASAIAARHDDYVKKPIALGQLSNLLNRRGNGSIQ